DVRHVLERRRQLEVQARLGDHFLDLTQRVDHAELALVDDEEHRAEQCQGHQGRGDDKSDSVHTGYLRAQRVSRSRVRELSRVRESAGVLGGVLGTGGAAAGGSGMAKTPPATCCMILSSGRYSRLDPWRDSTRTLVTLL